MFVSPSLNYITYDLPLPGHQIAVTRKSFIIHAVLC